jgi:hypothetical protein
MIPHVGWFFGGSALVAILRKTYEIQQWQGFPADRPVLLEVD